MIFIVRDDPFAGSESAIRVDARIRGDLLCRAGLTYGSGSTIRGGFNFDAGPEIRGGSISRAGSVIRGVFVITVAPIIRGCVAKIVDFVSEDGVVIREGFLITAGGGIIKLAQELDALSEIRRARSKFSGDCVTTDAFSVSLERDARGETRQMHVFAPRREWSGPPKTESMDRIDGD